ncbi:hypothetical protein FUAX_18570 [Fulvitalea axinellae]|uniref:RagB/SusD domain-containing protein n=1 Tax=Fulvitalea axinellae TaxID=1182444 RepID=A0AAU9CJD3_9BACT|nr:hypothetical protein FUAX_18570 [Fulvitalea axinellae]
MKNTTVRYLCLGVMLLGLPMFSCSDYFEPSQDLIQEREEHYNSFDKVRRATVGVYAGFQNLVEPMVVMGGLRADLMTTTRNLDADLREIESLKVSKGNPYASPRPFYDVILNCNDALANMEKSLDDPRMTERQYAAFEAEFKTVRAWTYFQLAQMYKEVPVITGAVNGFFPGYEPERYDFPKMVNWLIEEMIWANEQPILEWTTKDDSGKEILQPWRKVFINRNAFLGELFLTIGEYREASSLFRKCIIDDGGGDENEEHKCNLESGVSNWENHWKRVNDGDSRLEHISTIPFDRTKNQTHDLLRLFSNSSIYDYLLKPSTLAVNIWESQRPAESIFPDGDRYRGEDVSYSVFDIDTVVSKYGARDAVFAIYRAADVHLLLAEAENRMSNTDIALGILNSKLNDSPLTDGIRGRVRLKHVTMDALKERYSGIDNEVELVEQALIEERALELAFEGRRWNDLVRFAYRAGKPEWLAKRVASKFRGKDPMKASELEAKLLNVSEWRLHMPELDILEKESSN